MQRLMIILLLVFLTACSLAPIQDTPAMQAVTNAATVEAIPPTSPIEDTITPTEVKATATMESSGEVVAEATEAVPTAEPEPTVLTELVRTSGDTVEWYNVQTGEFEVLEHIKSNEIVRQGKWLTGVVSGVQAEIATGNEPKFPIAMVDLATGKLARGDFKNTAPKQILYYSAVKLDDGNWYMWEGGNQTWNAVTDETMKVILEAGEDPNEEYVKEDWAERNLKTFIARFHNVYVPNGTWDGGREKAPASFSRKVIEVLDTGRYDITIWGDGNQTRRFMYIDDCVKGIDMITHCNDLIATPINLGSNELISINALVSMLEVIDGINLERHYDLNAPRGVAGRNSDNTFIQQILGWEPDTPLPKGMERTYAWIKQQYADRKAGKPTSAGYKNN